MVRGSAGRVSTSAWRLAAVALVVAISSAGCASQAMGVSPTSGSASAAQPNDPGLEKAVQAALADAAARSTAGAPVPTLVSADAVTWPDGSIGCPAPGRMYTMALVPGYRIQIRAGNELLDYHATTKSAPVLCPAGRATRPTPGNRM